MRVTLRGVYCWYQIQFSVRTTRATSTHFHHGGLHTCAAAGSAVFAVLVVTDVGMSHVFT